jgi:hypothetical protein
LFQKPIHFSGKYSMALPVYSAPPSLPLMSVSSEAEFSNV